MIRRSAANRNNGGGGGKRDDVLGPDYGIPPGGSDGRDYQEGAGAAETIRDRQKDPDTEEGREERLSAGGS